MSKPLAAMLRVASVAVLFLALLRPSSANGQTVGMGISLANGSGVNPPGVETILAMNPAIVDGRITSATFAWTASPCPAAVTIKFFRPAAYSFGQQLQLPFAFLAQRGPFDVTAPLTSSYYGIPFANQTVTIDPPVEVRAGDMVAITNRTSCGAPVYTFWPLLSPPPIGASFTVSGDVTSAITTGTVGQYISLTASGPSPDLLLISDRFSVSLSATDPRTGATAEGVPNLLGSYAQAGYFSLPAFTGDPTFPEVTVKMVNATGSPALGGDFWFFHAPLTDVQYTLAVKDLYTGAVKTYTNGSSSPGQLCGGVDTSAFPGP